MESDRGSLHNAINVLNREDELVSLAVKSDALFQNLIWPSLCRVAISLVAVSISRICMLLSSISRWLMSLLQTNSTLGINIRTHYPAMPTISTTPHTTLTTVSFNPTTTMPSIPMTWNWRWKAIANRHQAVLHRPILPSPPPSHRIPTTPSTAPVPFPDRIVLHLMSDLHQYQHLTQLFYHLST